MNLQSEPIDFDALPPLVPKGASEADRDRIIEELVSAWCVPIELSAEEGEAGATPGVTLYRVALFDAEREVAIDLGELLRRVEARLPKADETHNDDAPQPKYFISLRRCRIDASKCDGLGITPRLTVSACQFGDGADFGNATFGVAADFGHATFGDGAVFGYATFGDGAVFGHARFGHGASFGHARFGDGAVFGYATFGVAADFGHARFGLAAGFGHATFGDGAGFGLAKFGVAAGFGHATFGVGAGFRLARFGDGADFGSAKFGDAAAFEYARFGDGADFASASFSDAAGFRLATFGDAADFWRATFGDGAVFGRATFGDGAGFRLATFGDGAVFGGASFGDGAGFGYASFGDAAGFVAASFGDGAVFGHASFGDGAVFGNASFGDAADFGGASFGDGAGFEYARFGDGANFRGANLRGADLRGIDFKHAQLEDTNLELSDLRDVRNLRLDSTMVRNARFSPLARDPWSVLRRTYTGPRVFFTLLFLLVFFTPYVAKTLGWMAVDKTEDAIRSTVEELENELEDLEREEHPTARPMRAVLTTLEEHLSEEQIQQLQEIIEQLENERHPLAIPMRRSLDAVKRQLPPDDGKDNDQWRKQRVWQLLIGTEKGLRYWLTALALLVFNVGKFTLTLLIAPMRDEEERSGHTPKWKLDVGGSAWKKGVRGQSYLRRIRNLRRTAQEVRRAWDSLPGCYHWLYRLHRLVRILFYISVFAFLEGLRHWLFLNIWVPMPDAM